MFLRLAPEDIGVGSSAEHGDVWGILMEMGYREGLATLLVLADGTTSLYWAHGRGVIGAGGQEGVRRAALAFLAASERHRASLQPVEECPLPKVGRVRFYCRILAGTLSADAAEEDLAAGAHPLSELFYAAHAVITEIRLVAERAPTAE
ncbi:MAG: hypothetical protein HY704_17030 [Gemmatimonadetes bacterium]|nr:hypothetical protein [Gemmatimonadota bacterium]